MKLLLILFTEEETKVPKGGEVSSVRTFHTVSILEDSCI